MQRILISPSILKQGILQGSPLKYSVHRESKRLFSKNFGELLPVKRGSPQNSLTPQFFGKQQKSNYHSYQQQAEQKPYFSTLLSGAALLGGGFLLWKTLNTSSTVVRSADELVTTSLDTQTYKHIPDYVHRYMSETYKYVAGGVGITALSAYATIRSGLANRVLAMGPLAYVLLFGGSTIAAMFITRSIDPRNTMAKHASWTAFNILEGISLCGLAFLGTPILAKAGLYTLAIFGALSFVAMNSHEEKFLYLGGPLLAGLTVIFVASLSRLFLPANYVRLGAGIDALVIYGGLILFMAYLLYDTQVLMRHAKLYEMRRREAIGNTYPVVYNKEELIDDSVSGIVPSTRAIASNVMQTPDYINESLRIYLDLINIFVRISYILANRSNKKK